MKSILLLLSAFLLTSCLETATSTIAVQTINKLDMFGTINGQSFDGVGVVNLADALTMRIQSNADISLLRVSTCHRDMNFFDAIKTGWFEDRRGFQTTFRPMNGIEDNFSCLIRIASYNQEDKSYNAWAVVDIVGPDVTLPALNVCNGAQGSSHGASICQSKAGLIQRVVFDTPVLVESGDLSAACQGTLSADKKTWEYAIALGECVVRFAEIEKPHRKHRHTTEGYNAVLYRGSSN